MKRHLLISAIALCCSSILCCAQERFEWSVLGVAEPSPFRISVLGLGQQIGPVNLFAGIRNTDPDFFDDEELGFFLGSSHGLPPTLSSNYDCPNYSTSTLMAMLQPVLSLFCRYGQWQTVALLRLTIELTS